MPPRRTPEARAAALALSLRNHGYAVKAKYGITPEQYWALYEFQGGKCAICRRATGKTKRLATDHDHSCSQGHPQANGCPSCVRGLLCGNCNKLLGHLRDDPAAFERGIRYLNHPPFQAFLAEVA